MGVFVCVFNLALLLVQRYSVEIGGELDPSEFGTYWLAERIDRERLNIGVQRNWTAHAGWAARPDRRLLRAQEIKAKIAVYRLTAFFGMC
jgi:hypothetical protein